MSERAKRVLLLLLLMAVTVGIGFAIYYVFFRGLVEEPGATQPGTITGTLPNANTGSIVTNSQTPDTNLPNAGTNPNVPELRLPDSSGQVSVPKTSIAIDHSVENISADGRGAVRFYDTTDQRFYKIGDDGSVILLSNTTFPAVDSVAWGQTSDKAILEFPDGSNIYYDFATGKQATLPQQWEDFTFSTNDDQISAKSVGNNENNRFLVVSNPDGTGAKAVEELGRNQDKVQTTWSPNGQVVAFAFTGEPLGLDRQSVLMVGQNRENFPALVVEGRGLTPNWSPNGQTLLYSVYNSSNGYRPTLWVSGASGDNTNANRRNLGLQTWADRCVWATDTRIYCAVPSNLGDGAALQPDLFQSATQDFIYRIDLSNGSITNLGQPGGQPSVRSIALSGDKLSLFLNDAVTGQLIRFRID